jgi:NAD+ synthase (glutamine-hydrolysing)
MARVMRVAGIQLENVVGDIAGNARRILDGMRWAEEHEADVVVFPELALTGYPLADLVLREEFVEATLAQLRRLARDSGRMTAVVGTIDRVPPRRSWDTRDRDIAIGAAVLCDGELRGIYHKTLLPNYEAFNEARNFAPGSKPGALWRIGEAVAGISICEDSWSGDGPPEAQAGGGARILLMPNASPFHLEKPLGRRELAASVARRNGTPVVYLNCVGGQDELVFDGGSLVIGADERLLYRAPQFRTDRFCVDVPLGSDRAVTGPITTVHTRPRVAPRTPAVAESALQLSADEQVWEALVLGTRDFVRKNGASTAVLGVSGGIDSAVTAAVAADALGADMVLGVTMPGPDSPADELEDAHELARALGIGMSVIPIEGVTASVERSLGRLLEEEAMPGTREALDARTRATLLLAVADRLGHVPLATGNKSELSIGSAALFGDMAGAFAPLKDCPKTLVYRLARLRNTRALVIPERVLDRPASVQEHEMHTLPDFEVLDPIVQRYLERGETLEKLVAAGFDAALVRGVLQLVDDAEYKRRQTPPGVKVTTRAFSQDLSMPITNAWRPFQADEAELIAPGAEPGPPPWTEASAAGAEGLAGPALSGPPAGQ